MHGPRVHPSLRASVCSGSGWGGGAEGKGGCLHRLPTPRRPRRALNPKAGRALVGDQGWVSRQEQALLGDLCHAALVSAALAPHKATPKVEREGRTQRCPDWPINEQIRAQALQSCIRERPGEGGKCSRGEDGKMQKETGIRGGGCVPRRGMAAPVQAAGNATYVRLQAAARQHTGGFADCTPQSGHRDVSQVTDGNKDMKRCHHVPGGKRPGTKHGSR